LLSLTAAMGAGVVSVCAVVVLQQIGWRGAAANGVFFLMNAVSISAAMVAALADAKCGRRSVLIFGTVGTVVALCALAAMFICGIGAPNYIIAILLIAYMAFYGLGPGVSAWTIAGEILPSPVRAKGMSAALLANQVTTTVLTLAFLPAGATVGYGAVFLLFAVAAIAYLCCVLGFFPGSSGDEA